MGLDVMLVKSQYRDISEDYNVAADKGDRQTMRELDDMMSDCYFPLTKSAIHPEAANTPTSLRSSYNSSGFNNAVPRLLTDDSASYYSIFSEMLEGSDMLFIDDLGQLERASEKAALIYERLLDPTRKYTSLTADAEYFTGKSDVTSIEAIKTFYEVEEGHDGAWSDFSNREGDFFMNGMTIYGAIPGRNVLGKPCVHLIIEVSPESRMFYANEVDVLIREFIPTMRSTIELDGSVGMIWSA